MTSKLAVTNQFDNFTNDHLADEIGAQAALAKEATERLDALKDEAKRRGIESATGAHYRIAITPVETNRLDTKALRELLGDALDPYYKASTSATLRISPVFQQEEVA